MRKIEKWKPIVGFEDLYEISNYGRIKSLSRTIIRTDGITCNYKEKIIDGWISEGYNRVTLSRAEEELVFKVHRLVGIHFISNPKEKPFINHKDCDRSNNYYENLEWSTEAENLMHAYKNGRIKRKSGLDSHMCKILLQSEYGIFATVSEAAAISNVSFGQMAAIIRGEHINKTKFQLV